MRRFVVFGLDCVRKVEGINIACRPTVISYFVMLRMTQYTTNLVCICRRFPIPKALP